MAVAPPVTGGARGVALEALLLGGDAAAGLDRVLQHADLSQRDRALATEIAYGTIKMRRALEWSVAKYLNRPIARLEAPLRWVLLSGAYQLLHMDRVAPHGAVNESVALAKSRGHAGTAAVANAVLRKIAAERPRPPRPADASDLGAFADYASLPDWIASHFIERFGFERACDIAAGINGPPRRALRVDTARTSVSSVAASLRAENVGVEASRYGIGECLVVQAPAGSGTAIRDVVRSRAVTWQSEESQLAVHLLDPKAGETVLDVCAGRGTKTAMLARRVGSGGRIFSIDDSEPKLAVLSRTMEEGSIDNVTALRADVRHELPAQVPGAVDAALVDAPCSALGVIGRRADARWRKRETDSARFAVVQTAALRHAAARVRSGGRLLYATCSTHRTEDEDVVDALVAQGEWRAIPVQLPSGASVRLGPYALTIPGIDGGDGFFYALLEKR